MSSVTHKADMSISSTFALEFLAAHWTNNVFPTLDLMDEVCDIIFTIFVTFLAVKLVDFVVGLVLVFLHRLDGVEE